MMGREGPQSAAITATTGSAIAAMQHIDIDALAVVLAVAKRMSFSAAARDLNRSQAAVSLGVGRLEKQLKHRLFERTPRGVEVTAAGEILVAHARRMLDLEDELLRALDGDAGTERVRLGLPDDYVTHVGAAVLSRFAAAWPQVGVEITCDFSRRLEALVERGDLDLAVITRERHSALGEKLRDEPQVWCALPEGRPEHEAVLPVALFNDQCRARPLILDALADSGRAWRLAYSCSHLHGIYAAVERGATAVLPASCVPARFRVLGADAALPCLPPLELALLLPAGAGIMARRLARTLRDGFAADQVAAEPAMA